MASNRMLAPTHAGTSGVRTRVQRTCTVWQQMGQQPRCSGRLTHQLRLAASPTTLTVQCPPCRHSRAAGC